MCVLPLCAWGGGGRRRGGAGKPGKEVGQGPGPGTEVGTGDRSSCPRSAAFIMAPGPVRLVAQHGVPCARQHLVPPSVCGLQVGWGTLPSQGPLPLWSWCCWQQPCQLLLISIYRPGLPKMQGGVHGRALKAYGLSYSDMSLEVSEWGTSAGSQGARMWVSFPMKGTILDPPLD